jgi:hypothetical protein
MLQEEEILKYLSKTVKNMKNSCKQLENLILLKNFFKFIVLLKDHQIFLQIKNFLCSEIIRNHYGKLLFYIRITKMEEHG